MPVAHYRMERAFASRLKSEVMASTTLRLDVSYGQIAVFSSSLPDPFNDWTKEHVAQGFAWRPGSVSFRTLTESSTHLVEVDVREHVRPLGDDVVRSIDVPFEVPTDGRIEVASISDAAPLTLPAGICRLRCEFLGLDTHGNQRVRLTFAKDDAPCFALVRADTALAARKELITTAQPAIS